MDNSGNQGVPGGAPVQGPADQGQQVPPVPPAAPSEPSAPVPPTPAPESPAGGPMPGQGGQQ